MTKLNMITEDYVALLSDADLVSLSRELWDRLQKLPGGSANCSAIAERLADARETCSDEMTSRMVRGYVNRAHVK